MYRVEPGHDVYEVINTKNLNRVVVAIFPILEDDDWGRKTSERAEKYAALLTLERI